MHLGKYVLHGLALSDYVVQAVLAVQFGLQAHLLL